MGCDKIALHKYMKWLGMNTKEKEKEKLFKINNSVDLIKNISRCVINTFGLEI